MSRYSAADETTCYQIEQRNDVKHRTYASSKLNGICLT